VNLPFYFVILLMNDIVSTHNSQHEFKQSKLEQENHKYLYFRNKKEFGKNNVIRVDIPRLKGGSAGYVYFDDECGRTLEDMGFL